MAKKDLPQRKANKTESKSETKETKSEPKTQSKSTKDQGGVSGFKIGNGAVYKGTRGHIKSISGLNRDTGDPLEAVFVPHDGFHEIELVDFESLDEVVRS